MLHPITPNKYLHFHTAKTEEEYFVKIYTLYHFDQHSSLSKVSNLIDY